MKNNPELSIQIEELIEKHFEQTWPIDFKPDHFREFGIELLEMVKANQSEVFTKLDAVIEARTVKGLRSSLDKALEALRK